MNTWYWYLVLIDVLNRYGIQEVTFQVRRDPLHEHFWQVSLDLMFFCIQVPNLCRYLALEFPLSIWVHPWRVHHSFSYLEGPATNSFPFSKRVVQLTTPLSHNPCLHMSPVRCIWILNWQTWSTHNLWSKLRDSAGPSIPHLVGQSQPPCMRTEGQEFFLRHGIKKVPLRRRVRLKTNKTRNLNFTVTKT